MSLFNRDRTFYRILVLTALNVVAVYLFVAAPALLPDVDAKNAQAGPRIPVARLFEAVNTINSEARRIYTARIVGPGKDVGLVFKETWTDEDVEAGPLPALFFRLVASELTKFPEPLSVFLGSDAPINPSNRFSGEQTVQFTRVKDTHAPRMFVDADHQQIGMFADVASAKPCVTCHNAHPASPRKDWALNDVMGAATWIYPDPDVSTTEYAKLVGNLYAGVERAWTAYLAKAAKFKEPPKVGAAWPAKDSRSLPDSAVFMAEVYRESAPKVLRILETCVAPAAPKPFAIATRQARMEARP